MSKEKKEKSKATEDIKSDFIRQFIFYFAIIFGLVAVAYIISILPGILSKGNQQPQAQSSNFSANQSELSAYFDYNCKESVTEDSRYYNVKYDVYSNKIYTGYVDYRLDKRNNGYLRSITYYLNMSLLLENNSFNSSLAPNIGMYDFTILLDYDLNFRCRNASYTILINNITYSENYFCMPPDIPFKICKENLTLVSQGREVITKIGSIVANEYMLESIDENGQVSKMQLAFSDLPFPILITSNNIEWIINSYSKVG